MRSDAILAPARPVGLRRLHEPGGQGGSLTRRCLVGPTLRTTEPTAR